MVDKPPKQDEIDERLIRISELYTTCCYDEVVRAFSPKVVMRGEYPVLGSENLYDDLLPIAVRHLISVDQRLFLPEELKGEDVDMSIRSLYREGKLYIDFRCTNTGGLLKNSIFYRSLVSYILGFALGVTITYCTSKKTDDYRDRRYVCKDCPFLDSCISRAALFFLSGFMEGARRGVVNMVKDDVDVEVERFYYFDLGLGFLAYLRAFLDEVHNLLTTEEGNEAVIAYLDKKIEEVERSRNE